MDDRKPARVSKSPAMPGSKPKRRFLKGLLVFGLIAVGLIAGLPWLLGTAPGRALVVAHVNARLAPGSIQLAGLGLSWAGPIELDGVALVDPKGKTVLTARRVTLDRGIVGLIASRPDYGTITVEGATVDVERRLDGSVDLLDALASLSTPAAPSTTPVPPTAPLPARAPAPSPMALKVVIQGKAFRLASPELVGPLAARSFEGEVKIEPGRPIVATAKLVDDGPTLEIRSTIDRTSADRGLSLVGKSWPIHVRQGGVEAKGRFEGKLEASQDQGLWKLLGDAQLLEFVAEGPALRGDRLAFDRVAATCDVGQSASGWAIRQLDLASPVGSLRGTGTFPSTEGTPARIVGAVDLAALAKALPNAMRLRDGLTLDRGTAAIRLELATRGGVDRLDLVASLDDFAATEAGKPVRLRQPVYATGKAQRTLGKVSVEAFEVRAAGVDVTAGGDLQSGAKLSGTVDLVALMAQLRDVLDLGTLDLSGHARVAADYRHAGDSFKGRFATEFENLKVAGPTAEPIARDRVRLDGWAVGPARPDGLPADWRQARLDLKADDVKLDLQANTAAGALGLVLGFEMAVASPVAGRLDARARLRKLGTTFEVDELTAGITPSDPKAARETVALAIRGRFDRATGEGAFAPVPGYAVGAFGLGPEGAKLSGVGRPGVPLKVDSAIVGDLGALDRLLASWNGTPARGLGGLWATQLTLTRSAAGKVDVQAKAFAPDLIYVSPRGPVAVTLKGGYAPEADRLDLAMLDLATRFGRVTFAGALAETTGRRLADLTATLDPNWAAIDPLLASALEPGARVRATARTLHLAGPLRADTTRQMVGQLSGEVALDLTTAEAFGVTLGPTPVVLKMGGEMARFDPIKTTLNDGPVSIAAELAMDGELGVWLRLGPSKVEGAAINQAVSDALLAYVAPVLAKSSGVRGRVTAVIDAGFVPITASGPMAMDGALAFQDVVFQPGPLGDELATITGRPAPELKINESMFVHVHDRRVAQNGLKIPLGGNGLVVAIEGSVGFDETLDLKATVPLAAKVAGQDLGGGTSVSLPIRGTLAHPAIDRKGLAVALREAAKAAGEKRLKAEAGRFIDRIAGPGQGQNKPQGTGGGQPPAAGRDPLSDLENLGRGLLDRKKK